MNSKEENGTRVAALLEGTFHRSGDAIVFLRDGLFFDCNPAMVRMYGSPSKEDFIGKHPAEVSPSFQPDGRSSREAADSYMRQALENGNVLFKWEHGRFDGTTFLAEIMLTAFELDGKPTFAATLRDINQLKLTEDEIARQREALHQSEKMAALGSLLTGIAHELNNPLAAALTQAVLLRETADDPRLEMRAQKIEAAVARCTRIVKSFLGIARQKPPVREPVSMADVVRSALDLTIYILRAEGVQLTVDVPSELPPILGDADLLTQVLLNLILNAQHALQDQAPPRELKIIGSNKDSQVHLSVQDSGPGIPPDIRTKIFAPFFTTKPVGRGIGIGLSLSRDIVRSHGGTLSIEETGKGACFLLSLPKAASMTGFAAAPFNSQISSLPKLKNILIVDDESAVADVLGEIASPFALQVDITTSGDEALRMASLKPYDLVISDLRMPNIDGLQLRQELLRLPHFVDRMLFVTGDTANGPLSGALAASGVDLLEKPFTPDEAREAIAKVILAK